MKLLKEYAFDAGYVLDPIYLDPDDAEAMQNAFFDEWTAAHPEVTEKAPLDLIHAAFTDMTGLREEIRILEPSNPEDEGEVEVYQAGLIAKEIVLDYFKAADSDAQNMSDDEMLYRAYDLVMKNDDLCERIRKQYRHYYVDEFQDTDFLQAGLIWKLASDKNGKLNDNALFVVGDPKQSIYRFRGAQVELFNEIRESFKGQTNADVYSLSYNYRSGKEIVQWVNHVYEPMIDGYTAMENQKNEVYPYHGIYRCPINEQTDTNDVVNLIQDMHNSNPAVHYRDFMVLSKDTLKINDLTSKLAEEGIPFIVRGKIEPDKVKMFHAYLMVYQGLAEKSTKLAPVYVVERFAGKQRSQMRQEEFDHWSEIVERFRKEAGFYQDDANAAARYLLHHDEVWLDKDIDITPAALRDGKIKILQCIDTALSNEKGGPKELARAMTSYLDDEHKQEIHLQSGEDAVNVMNVHQAKGLEAEIIIVADRTKAIRDDHQTLRMQEAAYPAFSKTPTYVADEELMAEDALRNQNEETRLEYVTATRAKHCLIFMDHSSSRRKSNNVVWFDQDEYDLANLPDIHDAIPEAVKCKMKEGKEEKIVSASRITDSDLEHVFEEMDKEQLKDAVYTNITPSSLEKASYSSGYSSKDSGYQSEDRPSQNIFGTVMHRVFELLINRRDEWAKHRKKIIQACVNQAVMESSDEILEDTEQWKKYLNERMDVYTKKILPKLLEDADAVYTEYPFFLEIQQDDKVPAFLKKFQRPLHVSGIMDLVVFKKDGTAVIYDYKSDARNGRDLQEFRKRMQTKYKNQLDLYRYALEKDGYKKSDVSTELIDLYFDEDL